MTCRRDMLASTAISILVHALALFLFRFSRADRGERGTALEIRVIGIVELAAAAESPHEASRHEEDEASPAPPAAAGSETPKAEDGEKPPEPQLEREEPVEAPVASVEYALGEEAETSEPKPAAEFSPPGQLGVPGDVEASQGSIQDARSRYIAEVLARIHQAKRYPPQARWKGEEGLVEIRFAIEAGGQVSSVEILKSSGHSVLDAEARAMVFRAAPFGEIPKEVGRRLRLIAPVRFELSPRG